MENKLIRMNTMFRKQDMCKITYADKDLPDGRPYQIFKYEVLDYIIIFQGWDNTIKDVTCDPHPNVYTDHYPLNAHIKYD